MPIPHEQDVLRMKSAHRILTEFRYPEVELDRGYAGRWLRVDLSKNEITIRPVTEQMKDLWVGGKGFDLWITLQEISPRTKWDSPENPICFSSGPLGGTTSFPGSGKTLCTSISPLTNIMIDCNVGGYFGPYLKFAGFDALCLTGKAREETILCIDAIERRVTIETAPEESIDSHVLAEELTTMYARDELDMRNVAVVSAGRGAQHTRMGLLNFSFWDWRRRGARLKQAGRGGIGTVFRDKNLKALVLRNRDITPAWRVAENKVAHLTTPKKISTRTCPGEVAEIVAIIERWGNDPERVLEMMQDLQERFRHIPKTALDEICKRTGRPFAQLYHIATLYDEFSLEPRGESTIQVCMGTACHVKGAARILDAFERVLDVKAGGTTADGKYSLEAVSCLGACAVAPVVMIDEEMYGDVETRHVERLLKQHAAGRKAAAQSPRKPAVEVPKPRAGVGAAVRVSKPSDLDKIASSTRERLGTYRGMLMVCNGTGCSTLGGGGLRDRLIEAIESRDLAKEWLVVPTGCNGFCAKGPILIVQPEGAFYQKVKPAAVDEIVESHLVKGVPVERLMVKDKATGAIAKRVSEIPFFSKQQLLVMRNRGLIDPEEIDQYIARGGYAALRKALTAMKPDDVIREVIASGLRGRGGGGFPTGLKWRAGRDAAVADGEEVYVVCNCTGALMERSIVEADPHSVIEGMIIGAYAVGAREGHVNVRKEYALALKRLHKAIEQAKACGLLGKDIFGTGFEFDIHVHRGAGAFVCGESSALLSSIGGRVGEPHPKYVHHAERGFRDKPTVLNNVETWANVPVVMDKGGAWFAAIGTGGTKVLSLGGKVRNAGLVEVPLGTTLREIVEGLGRGVPGGRAVKAIQTGGPSGGCLPASLLDTPVDYDSLTDAGSIMGSGGLIVMDDRTCMVDVARHFVHFLAGESCGKCTPCREGLYALSNTLQRICQGQGREGDMEFLEELSATVRDTSLCQLGGTAPNPVLSTIRYFREEYLEHVLEKKCRAGVCKDLIKYEIVASLCDGCAACRPACPAGAIEGEARKTHTILEGKCIKCGICSEVCTRGAVEVH